MTTRNPKTITRGVDARRTPKLCKQAGRHTWFIRYYVGTERRYKPTGTRDEAEAQLQLQSLLGDQADGRPLRASGKEAITFEDGVDLIRGDYKRRNRKSVADIMQRIDNHVRPYFGGTRRLDTITTKMIAAYGEHRLQEGAAVSTINREFDALSKMYTLAMKMDEHAYLRRPGFDRYSEDGRTRQGFFEIDEVTAMRRHLPDFWLPVLTFAFVTGWRTTAEVLTLEWTNVDRAACIIRLPGVRSKNKKGRVLAYRDNPDIVAVIEERWRARAVGVPWVFHRNGLPMFFRAKVLNGQPVPDPTKSKAYMKDWMREAWNAAKKAAKVNRIVHDFRRTAVRNLARTPDFHKPSAKAVTGHLTDAVFDNYDIVSEDDLARTLASLPAMPPMPERAPVRGRRKGGAR